MRSKSKSRKANKWKKGIQKKEQKIYIKETDALKAQIDELKVQIKNNNNQITKCKQRNDCLETQLEKSQEREKVTAGSQKAMKQHQDIIEHFMPKITFCRDSFEVMYVNMQDPLKALRVLQELAEETAPNRWKRIHSTDWREYDHRTLYTHRIYSLRSTGAETTYDVLISLKANQKADIEWLKLTWEKSSLT